MRVWATRSGRVLHATPACVQHGPTFPIPPTDALPHARPCSSPICVRLFARAAESQTAKAAA